jgi:hypothetical protein
MVLFIKPAHLPSSLSSSQLSFSEACVRDTTDAQNMVIVISAFRDPGISGTVQSQPLRNGNAIVVQNDTSARQVGKAMLKWLSLQEGPGQGLMLLSSVSLLCPKSPFFDPHLFSGPSEYGTSTPYRQSHLGVSSQISEAFCPHFSHYPSVLLFPTGPVPQSYLLRRSLLISCITLAYQERLGH